MILKPMNIATLNVHGWADAEKRSNTERVAQAIRAHQVDVIAFQEVLGGVAALAKSLGFYHTNTERGVALVSRFPILNVHGIVVDDVMLPPEARESFERDPSRRRVSLSSRFLRVPRCIVATLEHPSGEKIQVVCLYLDYLTEKRRMKQLTALWKALPRVEESSAIGRIILGDFNALNVGDYSKEELEKIAKVRAENNWEEPKMEVTRFMQENGLKDCFSAALNRMGPLATSRFDTRIDYIYADDKLLQTFSCASLRHVEEKLSDHLLVIAELKYAKNST